MTLKKLNLGMIMNELDPDSIHRFLAQTEHPDVTYPHVAMYLAKWIVNGNWGDSSDLVKSVWN